MTKYNYGQPIKILKGKNAGKIATFRDYSYGDYVLYSLRAEHVARIKIENIEPYMREFKGVPITELCSVCWV